MFKSAPYPLPQDALIQSYAQDGSSYTDCFAIQIGREVTFAEFVTAFYTTPLFKLEGFILKVALKKPSDDAQAAEVANGLRDDFAAWTVEARAPDQLLMCDMHAKTRSWFKVEPMGNDQTRLLFGSVVTASETAKGIGVFVHALMPFHKLYSVLLLNAAARNLRA